MAVTSVTNNFTKGLITEATGLNFPENAFTSGSNVIPTLIGDITRRMGINLEPNYGSVTGSLGTLANSSYKWNNAGGDGLTQIVVRQLGNTLFFYNATKATMSAPLSAQGISSVVNIGNFTAPGVNFDSSLECTYADGNGYLFVYHPSCDPFYVAYVNGSFTGNSIQLQIRDFTGVYENIPVNNRPTTLSKEHNYNLVNQGWTTGVSWQALSSNTVTVNTGSFSFTVPSGLTITNGTSVNCINTSPFFVLTAQGYQTLQPGSVFMSGTVTSYSGTTLVVNVTYTGISNVGPLAGQVISNLLIVPTSISFLNTWFTAIGNYPSNADVWWYFRDSTNAFNPSTTYTNVALNTGSAPQGHYLLNPFIQNRSLSSGIANLTTVSTLKRPTNGAWYQGRVWYTGVNDLFNATGDVSYCTWTENIYFSQVVSTPQDFGNCFQTNDPTSDTLNSLLPTDGGVIQIQGCGSIYKLFPIANGMLVFAANGVWFITGSQGIGFSANDYTITKISAVRSVSSYSFVDVNGLPYFWNEEGIYMVAPQQGGQLSVEPLTVGTILTYYNNIPYLSKIYARGAYDPINYIIQWVYRSTVEVSGSRYYFDTILNYNVYNKAFYPYIVNGSSANYPTINGIVYVANPGGVGSIEPNLMYLTNYQGSIHFGYEYDETYVDWAAINGGINYVSTFITAPRVHGNALYKFQMPYVYMYLRNGVSNSYIINGIWDYATSSDSGRYSSAQLVTDFNPNYGTTFRRHRIRGKGMALQIQVTSQDGQPFDIIGWAVLENVNQGV